LFSYSYCRRIDSFPQRSAIEQDVIVIDNDTKEMLEAMNFKDLSGVQVASEAVRRN
jgi:hypothetical protein